MNSKLREESSF